MADYDYRARASELSLGVLSFEPAVGSWSDMLPKACCFLKISSA